ncbi:unnamed protein product [Cochlearia groenlandica]
MASTPCAACKLLRRKCTQECVFAPYFPPTNPQKFICVHKVFGASNVTKILNDLPPINREDAVNSLYYEAEARLRDPIYGCVGPISFMQQYYKRIQQDLINAKEELAGYLGQDVNVLHNQQQQQVPSYIPPLGNNNTNQPNNFMMSMDGMPHGVIMPQGESMIPQHHDHHHNDHELNLDAQRMAAMILDRGDHHHHHQQQQQGMFNGYGIDNNGSVTATGYNQMDVNDHNHHGGGGGGGSLCGPSLALGSFGGHEGYDQMGQETEHHDHMNHHDHDHNHQLQTQLMLQPPLQEGQDQQSEGGFLLGQETLHEEVEDDQEELGPPVKLRKSENKDTSSY